MITRRQLLVSAAALSAPVAMGFPSRPEPRGGARLGLLQSRRPFIDPYDIAGSRSRALSAYRVSILSGLEETGSLDWLAGGAFPLSGPGPFPRPVLEQLALTEQCNEVQSLSALAMAHQLKLTLGAWWRAADTGIEYRLLTFDRHGRYQTLRPAAHSVSEQVQLHMPAQRGMSSLAGLAAQCRQQSCYGAWIEVLQGPPTPPGVRSLFDGSALVGPDGALLVQADGHEEACLVAQVS